MRDSVTSSPSFKTVARIVRCRTPSIESASRADFSFLDKQKVARPGWLTRLEKLLRPTEALATDIARGEQIAGNTHCGVIQEEQQGKCRTKLCSVTVSHGFRNEGKKHCSDGHEGNHHKRAFFHDKSPTVKSVFRNSISVAIRQGPSRRANVQGET